jgi:hypothetical protein
MEKKVLIEAAKALNEATYEKDGEQVPMIATKIKTVAVKEEDLKQSFILACDTLLGTELEDLVPSIVADAYNELVPEDSGSGETPDPNQVPPAGQVPPAEKKTPKAEKKEKAPAAEKKERKVGKNNLPEKVLDAYGNTVGSMSGRLNELLVKGTTEANAVAVLIKEFGRDEAHAAKKFHRKLRHLKSDGYTVTEKDGVFTLAPVKK